MIVEIAWVLALAKGSETKFDVFQRNKNIGSASVSIVRGADGSKETTSKYNLSLDSHRLLMVRVSRVDRLGQTIYEKTTHSGIGPPRQVEGKYAPNGDVELTQFANGKQTKTTVRFPKNGSRKDLSELWGPTRFPSNGLWYNFVSFKADTAQWVPIKVNYLGKKPVNVGGRNVLGHVIEQRRQGLVQVFWLDEKGDILQIRDGDTVMVRKWG